MENRNKALQKKTSSADAERLKGNRYFKAKKFQEALEHYVESLKIMPYDKKTLLNIAQVHIKLGDYDEAMEFISRTLYLNPKNAKVFVFAYVFLM